MLPAEEFKLSGHSYDNTGGLSATTWRHVTFVEKLRKATATGPPSCSRFRAIG